MTAFTYGEVCAGVGGLSRGLEAAGMECRFHAEIAAFPRRVLAHHWPDTPLLADLNAISGGRKMRAYMRRHFAGLTLLAGGTPCQDLSVAGKRAGLAGARSSLYFRFVRLWKVLDCPYILWENVAGALSSNRGADFAAVLSAIVGGTVPVPSQGWSRGGVVAGPTGVAAWRLLDAQWFGVPQRRLRVFVLGARAGGVDPAEVLLEPQGVRRHPPTRREAGERVADDAGEGAPLAINISNGEGRLADVMGTLQAREKAGGVGSGNQMNAVLSFGWQNSESQGDDVSQGSVAPLRTGTVPAVMAFDTTQVTSKANRSNPRAGDPCHPLAAAAHAPLVVSVTGDVTHALTHEGHDASEDGTGRGTPIVVGALQAADGKSQFFGAQAVDAGHVVVANAVCAREAKGWNPASSVGNGPVSNGIPRRLMPIECERLMGWDDGWTDVADPKTGKPASDAQRYKACGNGVVSACSEWIGERLLSVVAASEVESRERAA